MWQECWRFGTRNFTVVFEVAPCEEDPADIFQLEEDVAAVREGRVDWFNARVRVLGAGGIVLGSDYLSCCGYDSVRDFYTRHRTYKNRDYFGDMVREACRNARQQVRRYGQVKIREEG